MNKWTVFTDEDGKDRCAYIDCGKTCVAHVFADDVADRDRNAALIAAAPEMLDILRNMIFDEHGKEWIESETGDDEWDGRTWKAKQDAKALIAGLVPNDLGNRREPHSGEASELTDELAGPVCDCCAEHTMEEIDFNKCGYCGMPIFFEDET